ncbi:hypothetical protein O5D80_003934 [Batrachochytrium dendrobatidis]|nr:hypothetical protein O5D80_003934 [Batrachochytrium dendrobatidis]
MVNYSVVETASSALPDLLLVLLVKLFKLEWASYSRTPITALSQFRLSYLEFTFNKGSLSAIPVRYLAVSMETLDANAMAPLTPPESATLQLESTDLSSQFILHKDQTVPSCMEYNEIFEKRPHIESAPNILDITRYPVPFTEPFDEHFTHLSRIQTGKLKIPTEKLFEWAKSTAEDLADVGHDRQEPSYRSPLIKKPSLSKNSQQQASFESIPGVEFLRQTGAVGSSSADILGKQRYDESCVQDGNQASADDLVHFSPLKSLELISAGTETNITKEAILSRTESIFQEPSAAEIEQLLPGLICQALDQHKSILSAAMTIYDISTHFTEINQSLFDKVVKVKALQGVCQDRLEALAQLRFEYRFRRQELDQLGIPVRPLCVLSDLTLQFRDCTLIEQAFSDAREEYEMTLDQLTYNGLIDPHSAAVCTSEIAGEHEFKLLENSEPLVQRMDESKLEFVQRQRYTRLTLTVQLNSVRLQALSATIEEQLLRNRIILAITPLLSTIEQRYAMCTQNAENVTNNVKEELEKIERLKSGIPVARKIKRRATFPSVLNEQVSPEFLEQLKSYSPLGNSTSTLINPTTQPPPLFPHVPSTVPLPLEKSGALPTPGDSIRRSLLLTHPTRTKSHELVPLNISTLENIQVPNDTTRLIWTPPTPVSAFDNTALYSDPTLHVSCTTPPITNTHTATTLSVDQTYFTPPLFEFGFDSMFKEIDIGPPRRSTIHEFTKVVVLNTLDIVRKVIEWI